MIIRYVGDRIRIPKINVFVMEYSSKMSPTDDTENVFPALSFSYLRRQLLSLDLSTCSHCTIIPGRGLVDN